MPPKVPAKYEGYSGYMEKGKFIFSSMEERDRWQVDQYGAVRNGFREQDEDRFGPEDHRPLLKNVEPPFSSTAEELTYMDAVEANPRMEGEGAGSYIKRIAEYVQEKYPQVIPKPKGPPLKPMPSARQSWKERERELAKLREQEELIVRARDVVTGEKEDDLADLIDKAEVQDERDPTEGL